MHAPSSDHIQSVLTDPKAIGQAEYSAMHPVLAEAAQDCPELVPAILGEFARIAGGMLQQLGVRTEVAVLDSADVHGVLQQKFNAFAPHARMFNSDQAGFSLSDVRLVLAALQPEQLTCAEDVRRARALGVAFDLLALIDKQLSSAYPAQEPVDALRDS